MSEGFRKLMEDIESEAKSEGPAAEAELRELRREFAIANQRMTCVRVSAALTQGRSAG